MTMPFPPVIKIHQTPQGCCNNHFTAIFKLYKTKGIYLKPHLSKISRVIRQVTLISHASMRMPGKWKPTPRKHKKQSRNTVKIDSGVELANRQPPIKDHLHHQLPKLTVHFTQELQCQRLLLGKNITVLRNVIFFVVAIEVPLFTLVGSV